MLLTSGQVSVAISSFIVFLFTSALFLSGYVLQQQTIRDLRAAIKPKPTPEAARMYLPKQFLAQPTPSPKASIAGVNVETQVLDGSKSVVEMMSLNNDVTEGEAAQKDPSFVDDSVEGRSQTPAQDDPVHAESVQDQKPMVLANDNPVSLEFVSSTMEKWEEKPLSRAERRKKIKEEILAAGEGEGFRGYKRRQW